MTIILKSLSSFVGAAFYLFLFWIFSSINAWEAPAWAWFIVGWMGYDDFYNWLTFQRKV